jgi:NAD(P)-dependent dehydrogenase (short-subunit alcohol dehydrogenase family)
VQGAVIVPATAYIEMAFAAAREVLGAGIIAADEIKNLKPIILAEGDRRTIQTTLVVGADRTATFSVHSREGASPFIAHVTAKLAIESVDDATVPNGRELIDAVRARSATHIDGRTFYAALERKGNQWGPCFQGTQEIWVGDGEAVGRVQVPLGLLAEIGQFRFHPAVSDSCGHALVATVPMESGEGATAGAFVGGGVGKLRFHSSPATTTLWTHARLRPGASASERVVIGDVMVYDDTGALVSETLDARLWYLDEATAAASGVPDDWFYEPRWRQAALGAASDRAAPSGTWIVFEAAQDLGTRIGARRRRDGATIVVTAGDRFSFDGDRATIRPKQPEDYKSLIDAVPAVTAIVHLATSSVPAETEVDGLDALQVLHTLHAIVAMPTRQKPRLWLVTADVHAVGETDHVASPLAATLWGLGRTIAAEHAQIWGGLVDLAASASPDIAADHLVREVASCDAEDKVAYRGDTRFVERLERARPGRSTDVAVAANGTYLITGGLGGMGLAIARWIAERGGRHLLLIGRTALPPRHEWNALKPGSVAANRVGLIREIESLGARVEVAGVDIGEAGALERHLVERRSRGEPEVRGVIHAAGILALRPLEAENAASIRAMFTAKVAGAWRLHQMFASDRLDFFVLCSSSSALLRSPLLGAYAAANSFLDALAHHRRASGFTALSVNWGTWGEVGMAVEDGRMKGPLLGGMSAMPTASTLAALARLMTSDATQAAVMAIDWAKLLVAYPAFADDPSLSTLVGRARDANGEGAPQRVRALSSDIRRLVGDEQLEQLVAYLANEAARTLGMKRDRFDATAPLSSIGFDSLMAVQLKNQIEIDLEVVIPMIQLLEGPSIEQLAADVQPLLGETRATDRGDRVEELDAWEAGSV